MPPIMRPSSISESPLAQISSVVSTASAVSTSSVVLANTLVVDAYEESARSSGQGSDAAAWKSEPTQSNDVLHNRNVRLPHRPARSIEHVHPISPPSECMAMTRLQM